MPQLVALLQDNTFVGGMGANVLSKLAEQCKISVMYL